MSGRRKTGGGPQKGQMVVVRRQGARGAEDIAWGRVVGGGPGRPVVRIEGCKPDLFTGQSAYDKGEVIEFRRSDGFAVSETRPPVI